jgi:trehalose 6-phosphate synthase
MNPLDGIVVCSHRGPYSYQIIDGKVRKRPGSGGVVTALSALLRDNGTATWLACALSDVDRAVARDPHGVDDDNVGAVLLDIPVATHRRFYDDACITGLGFLFHGLVDQAYTPTFDTNFQQGWQAFRDVNRAYAEKIVELPGESPVLVEDYHLMLVADELARLTKRTTPTAYFHHISWCSPEHFGLLPEPMRREILGKLLAFDTLGFHARRWADAFLQCCDLFLPGVSCEPDRVLWRGREVPIVVAPAQIDVPYLQKVISGEAAQRWRRQFERRLQGHRAIVRVDRVDLWKNILRGFLAFENLVFEESASGVTFLALLARSRMHVPEYRRYMSACQREVRRINKRFADAKADARISVSLAQDHSDHGRALAGLALADAILVNPTCDGLNLVAKESVVASDTPDRLILSDRTGAYEEIGQWTIGVNPFDVSATAAAMSRALTPATDRNGAAGALRAAIDRNSPQEWLRQRLAPVL